MYQTTGKAYDYKGGIAVQTTRPPADNLSDEVVVLWRDKREISEDQRKKAWALIGEISTAKGYLTAEDRKQLNGDMKREFLIARMDDLTVEAIKRFSLHDVDMDTARLYIGFLIDFCVEHSIPTKEPLAQYAEDVGAYVYACLMNRVCAVCRRPCDLHHVDRIGMGRNRDDICHIGMECLPLCREHHIEAHQHGDKALMDKYHLETVTIDDKIAKLYKLGKKGKSK